MSICPYKRHVSQRVQVYWDLSKNAVIFAHSIRMINLFHLYKIHVRPVPFVSCTKLVQTNQLLIKEINFYLISKARYII